MANRKREDSGSGDWITIYADMVTLLLCFFVLLYSFSAIDNEKFKQFLSSFQGSGILDGGSEVIPGSDTELPIDDGDPQDVDFPNDDDDSVWNDPEQLLEHIKKFLDEAGLDSLIELTKEKDGVQMMMPDHLLFNPSQANITTLGRKLLERLLPLMEEMPNQVLVEGHTDSLPINTPEFPSNWELSAGRAAQVTRFFVEDRGLEPKRFLVIGYGEYHPIASNSTSEGRAANRRVVLVIRVAREVGAQ